MTQINFQLQSVPARDWSTERTADIKITLKQCSEETTLTPGQEEDNIRSSLPKMLDLTRMIIYNVF